MRKALRVFASLFLSLCASAAGADSWTLGVMEFSFRQTGERPVSSAQAASVLPQLIIEQFSSEEVRSIPAQESLDRRLKELQTARLSLFLQLSKEHRARDSLILTSTKPGALQKALRSQMEKIRDIEIQIDQNLEDVRRAEDEARPRIEREARSSGGGRERRGRRGDGFAPFSFFHRNDADEIVSESVVLYKGDPTALFKPGEKSLEAGLSSWDFEQEVVGAGINGLITGEITTYGDYCSVTASLRVYPGAKVFGTVTEVGLLTDLMPLALSIARNLDSKIANALPVLMEFDIEPRETARDARVMIDGVVFPLTRSDGTFDSRIIKDAGIHHISISAAGYEPVSFSYSFSGDSRFLIHAALVPEVHGVARIRLKKYRDGVFHTYGLLQSPVTDGSPYAEVQVNSKPVLGVFTVPKASPDDSDSSNIAFFRIPQGSAFDGASLVVSAKPFDREANIDRRRRWMYTAYTAVICTLPLTFYYMGEFTAENTAYSQGRGDYGRLLDLQRKSNICAGVTAACGLWAVVELVRYLWAADRVLPAKARIDKKAAVTAGFSVPALSEPLESTEDERPPDDGAPGGAVIESGEVFVD